MKEVGCQLVFFLLQFFFRHASLLKDRDIECVFLALEQVRVEEVDDLATILPGPGTQDSGSVDSVCTHVVVEQRVEVQVSHAPHLALETTHLQFGLVVHLANELLAVLKLHAKLFLLLSVEIRALL